MHKGPTHIQSQLNRKSKASSNSGAGITDKNKSLIYENCCLTMYLNSLLLNFKARQELAKPQKTSTGLLLFEI